MTFPQLSQFKQEKHIVIESYRKNGEPVRTTVWFVEDNGILYVRTDNRTGKVKRIRRNSKVRIALSNARGTLKSDWIDATAHVRVGADNEHIYSMLKKKYGIMWKAVRILQKFSRKQAKPIVLTIQVKNNILQ
jgi:PPOX class probable F420-dependent enzyme